MKRFLPIFLLFAANIAIAETTPSHSLVSGNAFITEDGIQKIVQEIILQNLKKTIQAEASDHTLTIPQKPMLNEILTTLGIANQVQMRLDPIETSINFGPDSFKVEIKKMSPNIFRVHAHLEIKELAAESKSLKIIVPKGIFDRAFAISSHPVKINLTPKFGALTADALLTVFLTIEGSKVSLVDFKTNLSDEKQRLQTKLGTLTVDGKPLELEIHSNGQSILTNEAIIRNEFQSFEPELMKKVQKQLAILLQTKFSDVAAQFKKKDPFKISIHSSEVLDRYSFKNPAISSLFKDISADFFLSYLQGISTQKLLSAQLSSQVCFGSDCLTNRLGTSKITTEDTANIGTDSMGVMIYESWVQNVLNSNQFQKRVNDFYKNTLTSPGTSLGEDGIKIHFNPTKNALVAVLNLKIDIKATVSPSTALKSWATFLDFSKKRIADLWENVAGSGQYIYIPVEISFGIKGIQSNEASKRELILQTELPFHTDGTLTNTYRYKSNVQDMVPSIRKQVLASVQKQIATALPKDIKISIHDPIEFKGAKLKIHQVFITKNKGLLISGSIQ